MLSLDNNINIKTSKQTYNFNLEEGEKINLEIINIGGEIFISSKPKNSTKSIVEQDIFPTKISSNKFTRVQVEDNSYEDTPPISEEFSSSIYNILTKQNVEENSESSVDEKNNEQESKLEVAERISDDETNHSNEESQSEMDSSKDSLKSNDISNDLDEESEKESDDYSKYYIPLDDDEDE